MEKSSYLFYVEEKPKMGFVIYMFLSKYLQKCTQNANANAKGCDDGNACLNKIYFPGVNVLHMFRTKGV